MNPPDPDEQALASSAAADGGAHCAADAAYARETQDEHARHAVISQLSVGEALIGGIRPRDVFYCQNDRNVRSYIP